MLGRLPAGWFGPLIGSVFGVMALVTRKKFSSGGIRVKTSMAELAFMAAKHHLDGFAPAFADRRFGTHSAVRRS
ncbi:MAG: hypothetical protein CMM70_03640 [Rhodospirillaceae bacterium]|nr:hypothetical protein [Rhodospirillaceae bacterium]